MEIDSFMFYIVVTEIVLIAQLILLLYELVNRYKYGTYYMKNPDYIKAKNKKKELSQFTWRERWKNQS